MKDQPPTDTRSVSPEVEALARELYRIGMTTVRDHPCGTGSKNPITPWGKVWPEQQAGFRAMAEHVIKMNSVDTIKP